MHNSANFSVGIVELSSPCRKINVCCFQPNRLLSPTTILKRQKGNCFEYSTLLCSLLIGAGYDAYVVSGYATREVCLADESREICPLLKKKEEVNWLYFSHILVKAILNCFPTVSNKTLIDSKYLSSLFNPQTMNYLLSMNNSKFHPC